MRSAWIVSVVLAVFVSTGCASSPAAQDEPERADRVRGVRYDADGTLVGHLALPEGTGGAPRPAVIVVHEWWGRTDHSDRSAEEIARMGYVGFALDMYGDGRRTSDPKEAGEWAGAIRSDPAKAARRFRAALDLVRSMPEVDGSRVAAIGFCFGGTQVLEAAWRGEDLRGVASFHGSLTTPRAEQVAAIRSAILVCHGADDPLVAPESIAAFERAMKENKLNWEMDSYGGAVHSFTNPAADGSFNPGAKYDARAAARSWARLRDFLAEVLR